MRKKLSLIWCRNFYFTPWPPGSVPSQILNHVFLFTEKFNHKYWLDINLISNLNCLIYPICSILHRDPFGTSEGPQPISNSPEKWETASWGWSCCGCSQEATALLGRNGVTWLLLDRVTGGGLPWTGEARSWGEAETVNFLL